MFAPFICGNAGVIEDKNSQIPEGAFMTELGSGGLTS